MFGWFQTKHEKLIQAIKSRNELEAQRLITAMNITELSKVDNNSETALTWAAGNGLEKVCEALIPKMSEQAINQVANNSETALTLAAYKGLEKVCELLIPRMSEQAINIIVEDGILKDHTALTLAASKRLEKVCESLILKMSPQAINQITKYGETALTLAAGNGLEKVCEVLILKMSVQAIDSVVKDGLLKGHTALNIAKNKGLKKICDLLTHKIDEQNNPPIEVNKQDQTQANLPASEENLYKVLQKMLEIQKLVENTADLYTHPISQNIKEVINKDQINNDMLIDLAGKLDKVLEEQTIINNYSCKERLVLFSKIAMDITAKLDDDNTISSNNKAIMQNVMNKIIDRVANLTNISLIEKITTSITELKTGKITKGKLLDIEDEMEGFILEQTNKEANMMLTWSVKEIVYDKPLLNHPKLLELALSKFSLQKIAELSDKLSPDIVQEAITNYDYELVLAALMSVENAEV